ncbi:MAG TPA: universal stress protein [Gemmatimonadaceae bacterium]|nr:universal stress protein [Gemmatimonadaceae bacterium]
MTTHILVPLDGSPFGEQAIPAALGLALRDRAAIELVLVQENVEWPASIQPLLARYPDARAEALLAGETYLDMVASRIREQGVAEVVQTLLDGPVVETLAGHIDDRRPDLVVMTTHGRGGMSRAWLGSVADALVRRVAVPVMLVRPYDGMVPPPQAPMRPLPWLTRIAVPLDGSAVAEEAIEPALATSGTNGVELSLLRVVPPPVTYLRPAYLQDLSASILAEMETDAARYLERVADRIARPGVTVRTVVFIDESAARGILAYAGGGAVDMIAMTTHGRRGLARLVIGSVADKVVRGAGVPVLLVRPSATRRLEASASEVEVMSVAALPPL